jgi:hypothetical protein
VLDTQDIRIGAKVRLSIDEKRRHCQIARTYHGTPSYSQALVEYDRKNTGVIVGYVDGHLQHFGRTYFPALPAGQIAVDFSGEKQLPYYVSNGQWPKSVYPLVSSQLVLR